MGTVFHFEKFDSSGGNHVRPCIVTLTQSLGHFLICLFSNVLYQMTLKACHIRKGQVKLKSLLFSS